MATSFEASDLDDEVASAVEDTVEEHSWLETLSSVGWVAKGVVYALMGVTAIQIARLDEPDDDASPQGSIGRIAEAPAGQILLAMVAVGFFLYALWRLLSVAVIRGSGASEWGDRIGYGLSAVFYLTLGFSAARASWSGVEPTDSSSIESLSSSVLDVTLGRWVLGLVGVVTIGIGIFFIIHKGMQRSFVDHLDDVAATPSNDEHKRAALVMCGIIGWIGRGVVTVLVGFFVVRAAWFFDASEARGFDQTLSDVATTAAGTVLVLACAFGLVAYGTFCLVSYRFRSLEEK